MSPWKTFWMSWGGAAVLTLVVFGRSVPYDFVYDDLWTIVRNPSLNNASPLSFFTDGSTVAAPEAGMENTIYRPLPTLSHALIRCLAGLRPWAFRLPNFLLHGLNGALVALLLLRLFGLSPGAAFLGGALFLLHPAQTESVVWITQRSNLMCAAGGLSALLLLSHGNPLGLVCYGAALLSKETAVTLLPFLLLTSWKGKNDETTPGRKKFLVAGCLILTILFLVLRGSVTGGFTQRVWRGSFLENLLIGQASWLEYIRFSLWPSNLAASHHQYINSPWAHPAPWIGAGLFLLWTVGIVTAWRQGARKFALALGWIPLTLSPHLGPLPLDTFVAERFLYLPLAGAAALGALFFDRGKKEKTGGIILLIGLAALSFRQTAVWRNEVTLWRSAVKAEGNNPFSRMALAEAYYVRGRLGDAAQSTRDALTLVPSSHLAAAGLNNLSDMALQENRPGAALRFAEKALMINPEYPAALHNRAQARKKLTLPARAPSHRAGSS